MLDNGTPCLLPVGGLCRVHDSTKSELLHKGAEAAGCGLGVKSSDLVDTEWTWSNGLAPTSDRLFMLSRSRLERTGHFALVSLHGVPWKSMTGGLAGKHCAGNVRPTVLAGPFTV